MRKGFTQREGGANAEGLPTDGRRVRKPEGEAARASPSLRPATRSLPAVYRSSFSSWTATRSCAAWSVLG